MEKYSHIRTRFETRMKIGMRPHMYPLFRPYADGSYTSPFTENAWQEYLAGWLQAVKEYC